MAPHAIIIPYPVQGHINPLIRLSEKLASQGIIITFVNTEVNHFRMMKARNHHGISEDPSFDIRFVQISDGLPLDFNRAANPQEAFNALLTSMKASAEDLIHNLKTQGCEPPISCVIGSSFLHWTFNVAKKFELPWVAFWSQAVSVHVIYRHLSMIIDKGDFPPKNQGIIDYIPGLPPLQPDDLPLNIQAGDPSNPVHQLVVRQLPALEEAACIIGNTVYELESKASDAINKGKHPPLRSIGPLLSSVYCEGKDKQEDFSVVSPRSLSMWAESNCLPWLDLKPRCSILYVSFGSMIQMSKTQVQEIAQGLMESDQAFLWVIRPDLVSSEGSETPTDNNDVLPEGFKEKTKHRGLVVPWSPQLLVLSHPSIGGFFTHGRWNSTVESLTLGVPMLVFPLAIEQHTNRMLIVKQWKVGLRLEACRDDGIIEGGEIARCVRALLEDEEIRKRSSELREMIREALGEGGSSCKNMKDFVEYLRSLPTNN